MSEQEELIKVKNLSNIMPYAYFNKNVVPLDKAVVSIASNSLQYGTLAFAGLRGYYIDGEIRVFRLKEHHERLMNAAKILDFNYYISYENFKDIFAKVINANRVTQNIYFRPFIFCDQMLIAPRKHPNMEFDLAIYVMGMTNFVDNKALKLKISSWVKFEDNAIPTKAKVGGAYINAFLANTEITKHGYDEAIILDKNGYVVESNVANIFIVYHNEILTPFTGQAALEGITSRSCKELLELKGYKVKEALIDRSMLYAAEEVIITGTAVQIGYAESIDDRIISKAGDGKLTTAGKYTKIMQSEFQKVINGEHPKYKEWVTSFK